MALSALNFFQIYNKLHKLGAIRLLQKSNIPQSIGLDNRYTEFSCFTMLDQRDMTSHKLTFAGHLQGFGLEEIEVQGDGNCFFTSVAFQRSNFFSLPNQENVINYLRGLGLKANMDVQQLSLCVRNIY